MKGLTQGRIFPRGDVLWISYYLNGTEYRESAKTADEPEARRFLKHKLHETGADKIGARAFVTPKAMRILISELTAALLAHYEMHGKASSQNRHVLAQVETEFGNIRALSLTSARIGDYIRRRRDEGRANAQSTA